MHSLLNEGRGKPDFGHVQDSAALSLSRNCKATQTPRLVIDRHGTTRRYPRTTQQLENLATPCSHRLNQHWAASCTGEPFPLSAHPWTMFVCLIQSMLLQE